MLGIRQTRTANSAEMIQLYGQSHCDPEMVRNRMKTLKLTTLGALAVTGMQGRDFVIPGSDGRRDTAIHPTAHQNHGFGFIKILIHFRLRLGRQDLGF